MVKWRKIKNPKWHDIYGIEFRKADIAERYEAKICTCLDEKKNKKYYLYTVSPIFSDNYIVNSACGDLKQAKAACIEAVREVAKARLKEAKEIRRQAAQLSNDAAYIERDALEIINHINDRCDDDKTNIND